MDETLTPTTSPSPSSSFDEAVLPAPSVRPFPIVGANPGPRYDQINAHFMIFVKFARYSRPQDPAWGVASFLLAITIMN